MTKNIAGAVAGFILLPLAAKALPTQADTAISNSVQALRGAGFAGLDAVAPAPTPTPTPSAAASPDDEVQEALAGLIRSAADQPASTGFLKETALALGFSGGITTNHLDRQSTSDAFRHFSITKLEGTTTIIVEVFNKSTKELRSYRASATGVLEAAAVTTKPNGIYRAEAISLPNAEAEADYRAQLSFWTQYYRSHLSH